MKGILEFDLPMETEEFNDAQNGSRYICALQEADNRLRALDKYEHCSEITIEHARAIIYEVCDELGISLFS